MKKSSPRVESLEFNGANYNIGYRITTSEMKSLGLRNNPNIIQYEMNKWIYPIKNEKFHDDAGGIWLARTLGNAKAYHKYMLRKHHKKTRIFKSLIGKVLFSNNERLKTDKIYLFEEIFLD